MITRLFDIDIAVKDFDAAVKKFSDILGVEPIFMREDRMPASGLMGAAFPVGGVIIGIIASKEPDTPVAKFLETKGEGVYLLGLEVTDIEEDMKDLAEKGVKFLSRDPIPYGYGKLNFVHPRSVHGVSLFFAEHDEGYYERFLRGG